MRRRTNVLDRHAWSCGGGATTEVFFIVGVETRGFLRDYDEVASSVWGRGCMIVGSIGCVCVQLIVSLGFFAKMWGRGRVVGK